MGDRAGSREGTRRERREWEREERRTGAEREGRLESGNARRGPGGTRQMKEVRYAGENERERERGGETRERDAGVGTHLPIHMYVFHPSHLLRYLLVLYLLLHLPPSRPDPLATNRRPLYLALYLATL